MFGTEGVEQVLRTRHEGSMSDLLARLLQAVHVFADGHPQDDDITIVLLARRGETAGRTTVQRYFPRSLDALDDIFRFVGDFIAARSLDAELHMPVCFIVEELFTNFIKYNADQSARHFAEPRPHAGAADRADHGFRRRCRSTSRTRRRWTSTKPLAERQPGGLGLHLVQQMATTLQYEYTERRSTITFTKSLEAG